MHEKKFNYIILKSNYIFMDVSPTEKELFYPCPIKICEIGPTNHKGKLFYT